MLKSQKIKLYDRIAFDQNLAPFLLLLISSTLLVLNGGYIFLGLLVFLFLFYNFQIPYKPGIFIILITYHFLQIISGVLLSNFLNKDISYRSEFMGNATLISYLGLCLLLLPVYFIHNKLPSLNFNKFKEHSNKISIKRTFDLYVVMFIIANVLTGIAFLYSGLTQFLISLKNIKWTFFILFASLVFIQKKMIKQFIFICLLEFVLGFFSFFSDFKTILIYLSVAYLPFINRITIRNVIYCLIVIIVLFFLGVKWTSMKGDYRSFLNQGKKIQKVEVDKEAAFEKLLELSSVESNFDNSAAQFLDRLQSTYHLAKTMERVPSKLPYEYGSNIGEIISFVTTPRFLNPDKKKSDNSVKTTKYTGIGYLGAASGVSISLGYFADCYIDFGIWGMLFPLFMLGCIYAIIYNYLINKTTPNLLLNYALVGSFFMETIVYESDGAYLLGRLFSNIIVYFFVIKFIIPKFYRYIKN